MTKPVRNSFAHPAARVIAMAFCMAACLHSPLSRAEGNEGDLAMTGLWKHDVRAVSHGHRGKAKVRWHCMLDDADPWDEFAVRLNVPGRKCKPDNEQRSAKEIAWTLSCPGHAPYTAHVDFDSNEHYTGSIVSNKREIFHLEGERRAACTDPSD